jgi:hypothetical protein
MGYTISPAVLEQRRNNTRQPKVRLRTKRRPQLSAKALAAQRANAAKPRVGQRSKEERELLRMRRMGVTEFLTGPGADMLKTLIIEAFEARRPQEFAVLFNLAGNKLGLPDLSRREVTYGDGEPPVVFEIRGIARPGSQPGEVAAEQVQ